jgi:class 3 adenylate cyclase
MPPPNSEGPDGAGLASLHRSSATSAAHGRLSEAFELQPEVQFALDAVATTAPWQTFRSAAAESDFVRFRGNSPFFTVAVVFIHIVNKSVQLSALDPAQSVAWSSAMALIVWYLLWIAAVVAFVVCAAARDATAAQRTRVARNHDWLNAGFMTVAYGVAGSLDAKLTVARCADLGFAGDPRCNLRCFELIATLIPAVIIVWRPRVKTSFFVLAVVFLCFVAGVIAEGVFTALDIGVLALLSGACVVAFLVVAVGLERAERDQFREHVQLANAKRDVAQIADSSRQVLRAALPAQLLNDDDALVATSHRSDAATVAVCDLADFAQWSCGLLVRDVVAHLHHLLSLCDLGAGAHGVVRVMAYGDRCVLCSGLLEATDAHAALIEAFSRWLLNAAADVPQPGTPFPVRVAVCTGELVGAVVGDASLRYFVAGAALVAAHTALMATAAGDIGRGEADQPSISDTSSANTLPAGKQPVSLLRGQEGCVSHEAIVVFSCGLRFDDPAVAAEHDAFVAAQEAGVGRFTAVVPPALFGVYLVIIGLEHLADDPRRHDSSAWAIAGLAVAFGLALAVAAVRVTSCTTTIPFPVLYGATIGAIALGCVSLMFTGCVIVSANLTTAYVLALLPLLPRLRWQVQITVMAAAVFVPVTAWTFLFSEFSVGPDRLRVFLYVFALAAHYAYARLRCQQFATHHVARLMVTAAKAHTAQQEALLAGLLPPHVVDRAATSFDGGRAPLYIKQWRTLSLLELALLAARPTAASRRAEQQASEALRSVWRTLSETVATAGSGLLELMQATGDTVLIAGPFIATDDESLPAAARAIVALLREVVRRLPAGITCTAVATSGSAFGALLGASMLTFRLCGAVVRESGALLAAAPPATATSVAFATDGFRQQHCNFAQRAAPREVLSGDMSAAVCSVGVRAAAKRGVASAPAVVTPCGDATVFEPPAQWRVRGVGSTSVSLVKLQPPECV